MPLQSNSPERKGQGTCSSTDGFVPFCTSKMYIYIYIIWDFSHGSTSRESIEQWPTLNSNQCESRIQRCALRLSLRGFAFQCFSSRCEQPRTTQTAKLCNKHYTARDPPQHLPPDVTRTHTHVYIYIYIYTYSYIICIYAHIYIYAGAFVRALIISYDFFTWHGSRWAMHEFTLAPRTPPSMTHARTARTSQVNPIDILAAETSSVDLSSAASSFRLQSLGL